MTQTDVELDTKGTRCPIPLLRAKQALKKMTAGQTLLVLATDPAAKDDFDAMLKHLPHRLLDYQVNEATSVTEYQFIIEKG